MLPKIFEKNILKVSGLCHRLKNIEDDIFLFIC